MVLLLAMGSAGFGQGLVTGELKKWHKVTITFDGPNTAETATPNPFRDYRLAVTFSKGPSRHVAQGYYAADGNAAESSATAVLGREACYTGQQILWRDMMDDPKRKPELYNLTLKPTAEDFEQGTVVIPKEHDIPIPGKKA